MTLSTLWFLSFRSFKGFLSGRGRSRQLLGSVVGMSLGLIPLMVVLVVTDGMISGITSRYLETATYHLQLHSYNSGDKKELEAAALKLAGLSEVSSLHWERSGFALGYSAQNRTGLHLRGLEESVLKNDPGFRQYLTFTSGGPDFQGEDGVLLGAEAAKKLGLGVGDPLKVLTARAVAGRGLVPRISTFLVRGVFSSGYQELDKLWAFIPLSQAERILVGEDYHTILGVKVSKPYENLEPLVGKIREGLAFGLRVYTWYDLGRAQYKNFQATRTMLLFIMAMILLVSAVNISSAILMIVLEKQKDIAILKALGASPGQISLIFILMGFFTGLAGTSLGVGVGLAAAVNVNGLIAGLDATLNFFSGALGWLSGEPLSSEPIKLLNSAFYLERIPIVLDLPTIAAIAVFSIFLAALAAWFPAGRAGRLKPLEVLRKW